MHTPGSKRVTGFTSRCCSCARVQDATQEILTVLATELHCNPYLYLDYRAYSTCRLQSAATDLHALLLLDTVSLLPAVELINMSHSTLVGGHVCAMFRQWTPHVVVCKENLPGCVEVISERCFRIFNARGRIVRHQQRWFIHDEYLYMVGSRSVFDIGADTCLYDGFPRRLAPVISGRELVDYPYS